MKTKPPFENEFDHEVPRNEDDPRPLAVVYGKQDELPGLGDYLIEAVVACRDDNAFEKPKQDEDDEKISLDHDIAQTVHLMDDGAGLTYYVSNEPLSEDEHTRYSLEIWPEGSKSVPVPLDMWPSAAQIDPAELRKDLDETGLFDNEGSDPYDIVNKARHYNQHPSGIECIELAKNMSFNLGSAFKYVFRRGDKGNAVLDLNKAEYYLKNEIERLTDLLYVLPAYVQATLYIHPALTLADDARVVKLINAEQDVTASMFYKALFDNRLVTLDNLDSLRMALYYVAALREAAEKV